MLFYNRQWEAVVCMSSSTLLIILNSFRLQRKKSLEFISFRYELLSPSYSHTLSMFMLYWMHSETKNRFCSLTSVPVWLPQGTSLEPMVQDKKTQRIPTDGWNTFNVSRYIMVNWMARFVIIKCCYSPNLVNKVTANVFVLMWIGAIWPICVAVP